MLPGSASSPTEPPLCPTWQSSAAAPPGPGSETGEEVGLGLSKAITEEFSHQGTQVETSNVQERKLSISYRATVKKLEKLSGNYHRDQHLQNCTIIQKDVSTCSTRLKEHESCSSFSKTCNQYNFSNYGKYTFLRYTLLRHRDF